MAKIQRIINLKSFTLDENLIKEVFKIIKQFNTSKIKTKTQILVNSKIEKNTYESLNDYLKSKIIRLDKNIDFISFKLFPKYKNEGHKMIQFHLYLDQQKAYFSLIGYNDDKLDSCIKKLNYLFNREKNWYHFIYSKYFNPDLVPLLITISFGTIIYKLGTKYISLFETDTIGLVIFIICFAIMNYIHNIFYYFFPFVKKSSVNDKAHQFWENFLIATIIGLLANLIWFSITFIFT